MILAKLFIFRYWGGVNWPFKIDLYIVWGIFHFHEKYWGDAAVLLGEVYIPPSPLDLHPCLQSIVIRAVVKLALKLEFVLVLCIQCDYF